MSELTHLTADGDAHMVDVGGKAVTDRRATAEGWIALNPEAYQAVVQRKARKGDVLMVAQLAGIQAAKRTADLVPLCHPLPLSGVTVQLTPQPDTRRVRVEATVKTTGRTGVEMEALTAVQVALLTVYDMLKAVDRSMEMGGIRLLAKEGGRSGSWVRAEAAR